MARMDWEKVNRRDAERRERERADRRVPRRRGKAPGRVLARLSSGGMAWVKSSDARRGPEGWEVIPVAERVRAATEARPVTPRRVLSAKELRVLKKRGKCKVERGSLPAKRKR
jgi:hypothetical protein